VTVDGARANYGVVIREDGTVDEAETALLRDSTKAERGEPSLFNFGFRTGLKASDDEIRTLLAQCKAQTGLDAPLPPSLIEDN
jgi:N-methylhydantoinase B